MNHNGDPQLAFELIEAAANAGVDAVKFQTFQPDKLVTRSAPKAAYQQASVGGENTQLEMLSKLQLDFQAHHDLKKYAQAKGLVFLSTAFDSTSLSFLVDDLELDILKIPSGEVTNGPLLLEFAHTGRNLILSTGMSTLSEVSTSLSVLAFGLLGGRSPSPKAFASALESKEGQMMLKQSVVLLHCTTQYPAPIDSVNLSAMKTMQKAFGLEVGYSDHTNGWVVACAAVAMGARVIEKHFTLDRSLPGPDHSASLEPSELRQMVDDIRIVTTATGDGRKVPHKVELKNRDVVRKSIVAARSITKGEQLTERNILLKRPGTGRSPMDYWDLLGSMAVDSFEPDDLI